MILHHNIHKADQPDAKTLVFIHGLFGSLSNLGMLARAFQETNTVVQIDVRNHGKSEHSSDISYADMSKDVVETLDSLNIDRFSAIGHSMGGKIAMKMTELAGTRMEQLAVLDMAPFAYHESHHEQIFKALFAVQNAAPETRQQATEIMKQYLNEEMVILFLMKSFIKGGWQFNLDAIFKHYQDILGWQDISVWQSSALFLKGGNSPYISKTEHRDAIAAQFPQAETVVIEQAGHWLHAEKTEQVIQTLKNYLQ
ncbi:alpha/beta fold hydrolase [Acinetobacter chinensis]|uniref:Alpha/beta fold hydrolase n=1 Tax=Acinetobacter chinensis TaxID=2004650 RepID=A0A3B7M1Z5_9GAMM|nr:alpha/beta fold hydrolase [Acinetobacter chinensis]AXY56699.1 alpha/beta fold hydrolase [Acinetobacter chinensis]